jgi:hypothetical protein
MYQVFATPLRSNYAFSQIAKDRWDHQDGFKSIHVNTPTMDTWDAVLFIADKQIKIHSVGQQVFVEGVKLAFEEMLNLRQYIRKNFLTQRAPTYNGKGELVNP